ncbi:DUF4832 domain-containing protein [Neolewinella persica]|uniref:DUF4832 domain-containing protein n=1 Tax=Neolewinella persica TaxID=70998 RepID=UPI00036645DC|nr:DUF4832 domain-containing protein [Neolewinella persica]
MLRILLFLPSLLISVATAAQITITYQSSAEDFPNPERGFYRYTETRSGNYSPLVVGELQSYRNPYTPGGASYSVVSTLAFRYFFLEDFKAGPISQNYLNEVAADFAAARAAGVKLIPRFAYTDEVNGSGCLSFICPPYGDAPKAIILQHINQLGPILAGNKDVIAAIQMGFIGVWGENYYTDYFGDASPEGNSQLFDADWEDRNDVLEALLAAVPAERMVQVRYPQLKQRLVYGINAPTNSLPLTVSESYSGSDKARLGFHNDCLLASADDFGTYANYGNSSSGANSDTANLKPYFAEDSRFVVVGGETCSDGYNPQNNCSSTNSQAFGDSELRRLHYSYLNSDYNQAVNNDWQSGGCMDAIKRSLGYRFNLTQGNYPVSVTAGSTLPVTISLQNAGYAAPFNERKVELILRETTSGEIWRAELAEDPRRWQPESGTVVVSASPCLPASIPIGNYELMLHLPDPMPTLYGRADYSIRLGSLLPGGIDGWEPTTGFNRLGQEITITGVSGNCGGGISFVPDNQSLPLELLTFTGQARDKAIHLKWVTQLETDLEFHEILRSEDGVNFSLLARKNASNSGNSTTSYSFTDRSDLANDWYYYRLRSVDFDGSIHYSSIIRVTVEDGGKQDLILSPNPSSERIRLMWVGGKPEGASIQVFDILGQLLFSGPLTNEIDLRPTIRGNCVLVVNTASARWIKRIVIR